MDLAQPEQTATWHATWLAQAHTHPYITAGLGLALAAVAWLLLASIWRVATGEADAALRLGLLGGWAGFAATAVGALPALFMRGLSSRTEDTMLGLAAGMMLAASSFSLIRRVSPPAGTSPEAMHSGRSPWWQVSGWA